MSSRPIAEKDPRLLDPKWYGETFIKIRTKEQQELPFLYNPVQRSYYNRATIPTTYTLSTGETVTVRVLRRGMRDLVLKGRQHGFSTLGIEMYFQDTITNVSTNTAIIAHRREAAEEFLNTIRFMYDSIPPWQPKPRIGRDNKGVIEFPELGSKISVGVVGEGSVRSGTIHNLLATEVAFWGKLQGTMAAALEAVPVNGNVLAESTPRGVGGWYYSKVIETRGGGGSWRLFEYPWFLNRKYQIPRDRWKAMKIPSHEEVPYDSTELELIATYKLTPEQIAWRRWKIGESDSRTFAQEYECDFLQSGRPVFHKDYVLTHPISLRPRTRHKSKEGGFNYIENPVAGKRYIMGVDISEGLENNDYDVATIIDWETGREVAKLRGHWPIDVFAEKCFELFKEYNLPVVVPERNNHGHAFIGRFKQLLIQAGLLNRLYYHSDGRFGRPTDKLTKAMMVTILEEALRKGRIHPADQNTIDELIAYEWKSNGTTGAPEGVHDDSVIALGLAACGYFFHIPDSDEDERDGDEVSVKIIS